MVSGKSSKCCDLDHNALYHERFRCAILKNMLPLQCICADITTFRGDALVNAANSYLLGGGGVDGAIHKRAGPQLLQHCQRIGFCAPGQAVITPGCNLSVRSVIHTVGPVWRGGGQKELHILASCYDASLQLALQHQLFSIAFPAISTGVYGVPFDLATEVAVSKVLSFLQRNDTFSIWLYFFSQSDLFQAQQIVENQKNADR